MELMLRRSVADVGVKVEKEVSCGSIEKARSGRLSPGQNNSNPSSRQASTMNLKKRLLINAISGSPTPGQSDEICQLESAKDEIDEARAENQRVKTLLSRIMKDYESLQMQFYNLIQDQTNKPTRHFVLDNGGSEELVSLSLGRTTTETRMEKMVKKSSKVIADNDQLKGTLSLGLNFKLEESNQKTAHSCEENKDERTNKPSPSNKVLKTLRPGNNEESEQSHVKRARVSVRARCDAPNMNDGCQWRKYGQKMSKGNPCPRAYYRCSVAPGCPVRKQVQRCVEDMAILITTYVGTHNHPLPASAAAMASTTSAATTTLTSGSSPSLRTTSSTGLQGLDFNWSSSTLRHNQFYLPNPSDSSLLTHPIITLDLTSPSSSTVSSTPRTRSPSPYLNFSSSDFSSQASNAWRSTSNMS